MTYEEKRKKAGVVFMTVLLALGTVCVTVSAHFTMGNHQAAYPFRNRHFDPHVDGLIGYVFPGGGLFTSGAPGWYWGAGTNTYPGYQSPWPYWTGGVNNPWPAQGPYGWYQLDANNYAPFGAILTSTIKAGTPFTTMWKANRWASDNPTIESLEIEHAVKGDMILAFNVTAGQKLTWRNAHPAWTAVNFTLAQIMIPPEFTGLAKNKIVTSFTNNYDLISVGNLNREEYWSGAYWTELLVKTDTAIFGGGSSANQRSYDKMDDAPDSWLKQTNQPFGPFQFSPWKTFGNITFSLATDSYGHYVDEWYYIRINDMTAPTIAGTYTFKFRVLTSPELGDVYFPYQNWPIVLVKGEVDPAIITGTIRYGGWSTALFGQPVALPGRVRAVGIADDPYTGKSTGRPVEARGYFDADWNGHYEVEGVAPGVYDIYASAAGYPDIKIASSVKTLKGQSYHIDGYLTPGAQIRGTVFSKCGTGETPFFNTASERNIKIEIYRSLDDAQSMLPGGSTSKAATWSPYGGCNAMWGPYGFKYFGEANPARRGVGPSQNWYVTTGATSFTFQFGREGFYGAPADMVGHVPGHTEPTWVSGLGAGTYWVRAWLYGYVQTQADGVTFDPVSFTIPSVEWPGNVWVPFDLRLSSYVTKTVHFHDVPGTLMENPIGWGWSYRACGGQGGAYYRYLSAELVAGGRSNYQNPVGEPIQAWEIDPLPVSSTNWAITIRGFKEFGEGNGYGRSYGIPAGLYTVRAYMWGYVEQVFEKVHLGLCGTETLISDHMYRGAKFNITLYSKDWEHPTVDKTWSFPYMPIYIQIMKDGRFVGPKSDHYVMALAMQAYGNTSVAVRPYMWNNPWFMLKTHDGAAQTFGPDNYRCIYGSLTSYFNDYFGPSAMHGAANGVHFRYYDGSESWQYYSNAPNGNGPTVGYYPLSFETGLYEFHALTYGYVQKKPATFAATKGDATSDIMIKLTQGAELQLIIKFKHEGIFEGIPFDAHLRIRILDDRNRLVGEYLTSDWSWQPQFEWTSNATKYTWNLVLTTPVRPNSEFDPAARVARSYWRLNYVPTGTKEVKVVIAGLPDLYWASPASCDPCASTSDLGWQDRPIDAPYGIDAYPNYKGGWKVQVHVVPIFDYYPGHYWSKTRVYSTFAPALFVSWGTAPIDPLGFGAMLTGELTYTADMKPIYINHLGPYELRYDVTVPGTNLGGESSLIFELDRRGLVDGTVVGYTYCDDWRSAAWTTVQFTAADGTVFSHYTFDGWFAAWLPMGQYTAAVIFWTPAKGEGYKVQTMPYFVSDGSLGSFNVYLEQSGVPIPEFQSSLTVLTIGLATSLIMMHRTRKKIDS